MSTITLMRVYMKYHNLPRLPLPCVGYAGILYTSSLVDRQRFIYKDETGRTTSSPGLLSNLKVVQSKGAIGSYLFRRYSTASVEDIKKAEKARQDKSKFKLKTTETVKVLVVSETGSLSAMTLEDANKLARKKNLKLAHITNPNEKPVQTEKEVYKLVSKLADLEKESQEEDAEVKNVPFNLGSGKESGSGKKEKELKTVLMKSNIGEHDANSRIKAMMKWITKGHRIRVAISQAGDKGNAETLFKTIEKQMTEVEGQIQQKTSKGNEIRFYVGPPKNPKSNKTKNNNPSDNAVKVEGEACEEDSDSDDEIEDDRKRKSRR